jgi:hypothetical protein
MSIGLNKNSSRITAACWGYGFPTCGRRPIFPWLTLSSFSPERQDLWSRDLRRPYEIVLLPGYQRPPGLNVRDIDAIWYDGEVASPTVVWDSFGLIPIFEIISECFDPHREMSEFIKVRDAKTGGFISDARPESVLHRRPIHDFRQDILSFEMEEAHKEHFESLPYFYQKMGNEGLLQGYMHFAAPWEWKPKIKTMNDERAAIVDRMSPEACDAAFERWSNASGRERLKNTNLRFGLSIFEKEELRRPPYYQEEMLLERRISSGKLSTPEEIVDFKVRQRIPISDQERKVFENRKSKKIRSDRAKGKGWRAALGIK